MKNSQNTSCRILVLSDQQSQTQIYLLHNIMKQIEAANRHIKKLTKENVWILETTFEIEANYKFLLI